MSFFAIILVMIEVMSCESFSKGINGFAFDQIGQILVEICVNYPVHIYKFVNPLVKVYMVCLWSDLTKISWDAHKLARTPLQICESSSEGVDGFPLIKLDIN